MIEIINFLKASEEGNKATLAYIECHVNPSYNQVNGIMERNRGIVGSLFII